MEAFLNFFETMPSWQKLVWIIVCISANWIIELGFPLVKLNYKKWQHAKVNLIFLSTSVLINVLFGLLTLGIFAWLSTNQFGLLYLVDFPIWAELLIAVAILDFTAQYLVHYLLHKVAWMWRFHMVHHSDTNVDVTTATRHHPGDYVLREVFALIAIFIAGIPLAYYLFYRILTNFGNIFSFWDRIFGTLVYDDPTKVVYGLDVLDDNRDEDVIYQFKVPFNKDIKTDY